MGGSPDDGDVSKEAPAKPTFAAVHPDLREAVILLVAGLLLLGLGASFGPGGVGLFLGWVPVAALTTRQGTLRGTLLALVLCLPLLGHVSLAASALFGFLTGGVLVGWGLSQGWGAGRTVQTVALVQFSGAALAALLIALVVYGPAHLATAAQAAGQAYTHYAQNFGRTLLRTALQGGASIHAARSESTYIVREMTAYLPVLPAVLAVAAIINVSLGVLVADRILRAMKTTLAAFPDFALWSTPAWLAVMYLAGLGAVFALPSGSLWSWVGINVASVCQVVLFVHGLALLYYGASRIRIHKTLRILGAVLVTFIPLMQEILAILGAVDAAADVRKVQSEKSL